VVPDLQQCLLRNRKVSQQEHDRSKSDKNLKTLSGRVPYGVLALSGKAAEKANTPNREQGYSHLRGTVLRLADMSQKKISTTSGHFIVVSSAAAVQYRKSAGLACDRDAIVVPSAIVELEGDYRRRALISRYGTQAQCHGYAAYLQLKGAVPDFPTNR